MVWSVGKLSADIGRPLVIVLLFGFRLEPSSHLAAVLEPEGGCYGDEKS